MNNQRQMFTVTQRVTKGHQIAVYPQPERRRLLTIKQRNLKIIHKTIVEFGSMSYLNFSRSRIIKRQTLIFTGTTEGTPDLWLLLVYSRGCREALSKVTRIAKITKFTKTAKFTKICHTTYKINEIYWKGCREGPSKVTKITKFTKTAKFTTIRKTIDKFNEIYSNSCREGPSSPFFCFINHTSVVTAIFARIC